MIPNRILAAFVVTSGLSLVAAADETSCLDPAVQDTYRCREVVIEFDPATADLPFIASKYNLRIIGIIPEIDAAWTEAPIGADVPGLIDAIQGVPPGTGEPGVIEAERNGHTVNPECRRINADVIELGRDAGELFRSQPARTLLGIGKSIDYVGAGVMVAVLDTGVSRTHPELQGTLVTPGMDYIANTWFADDLGNGIDDDLDGETDRGHGHGTAVAGLIHLVAPQARILPVRVLDDECNGNAFAFAAGVVGATNRGATVLNLSFGSLDKTSIISKAISYALDHGALVVAPAGNGGTTTLQFPASDSEVLAVAAIDNSKVAWDLTDYHSNIDLSAPGVDVVLTYRDGYIQSDGTSFATAWVSGAATALRWADPSLRGRDVQRQLEDLAIDLDPYNPARTGKLGKGMPWLPSILEIARGRGLPTGAPGPTTVSQRPAGTPASLPSTGSPGLGLSL